MTHPADEVLERAGTSVIDAADGVESGELETEIAADVVL